MISRREVLSCCLLSLGASLVGGRAAEATKALDEVMIGLPNNVYANYQEGRPNGVMVQAISAILAAMGRKVSYIVMPSSALIPLVASGKVHVAAVAFVSSKGPKTLRFSDPLLVENNIVAVLRDNPLTVSSMQDLAGRKLGGRTGYSYPMLQDDPRINLVRFRSDAELMRNLIFGHIEAAIISSISDLYKFRAEGVMSRLNVLDVSVGSVPLRAAFSMAHFSEADIATFNERLARMKEGPEWLEILDNNGMADLVRDWPTISK